MAKVEHLVIAVPCYSGGKPIRYLHDIAVSWAQLAPRVDVILITDDAERPEFKEFAEFHPQLRVRVVQPSVLGHPYFLTWIHRELFKQLHVENPGISHYLYLEDDIVFGVENLEYWLEGRRMLRPLRLFPGFLRFEIDASGREVSTDVLRTEVFAALPRVDVARSGRSWVNLRSSYEGMWLMDRELFEEFLVSDSFGPDFGHWKVRERATQGLIFQSVPAGCFTRKFVGVLENRTVDPRVWIHHLSNRYAVDAASRFAKIPSDAVVDFKSGRLKADLWEFFRSMNLSRPRLLKKLRAKIE